MSGAGNSIVAFFSYTRADDRARRGRLSYIRERLEVELRTESGEHRLEVFQDTDDIALGEDWDEALSRALGEAVFFIPMLTPSYLRSEPCLAELERFRRRERELGRNDLILPVCWRSARDLQSPKSEAERFLASRQWQDWRGFSRHTITESELDDAILGLATTLDDRLNDLRSTDAAIRETPATAGPAVHTDQEGDAIRRETGDGLDWARDFGRDAMGPWADLAVGDLRARLRWCPPGRFMMGSPQDEEGRFDAEGPETKVTFAQGFWLFETAVTQALYEAVMGENPSRFKGAARPVERVSWAQAQDFIGRLNAAADGLDLALPSEAQWEYACRAGSKTPFEPNVAADFAGRTATTEEVNYDGNYPIGQTGKGVYREQTVTAKGPPFRPNAWGLWHMHGNLWEWCADHWHGGHEGASRVGAPREPGEPESGVRYRVVRGGSWCFDARYCRAAFRFNSATGTRFDFLGFRPARGQVMKPGG